MAETTSSDLNDLKVHQKGKHNDPLNAEPDLGSLTSNYITPVSQLFHRNHDDIVYEPKVEQVYTDWKISLRIDSDVSKEQGWKDWEERDARMFPVQDLIEGKGSCEGLQQIDTTATIECAGNRRDELAEEEKAEGIQWGPGVIANVFWTGASIRSLLLLQGIPDPYSQHEDLSALTPSDYWIQKDCASWARSLHLHLLSAQPTSESERPEGEFFGASIPLSTAMHPNQRCILAHKHNGKTLEQAHGFPLRSVIPGHAGARWVKWLRGLRISKSENDSPPMQHDYKILKPPSGCSAEEEAEWKQKMMGSEKDVVFRQKELEGKESMQRLGMGSAIDAPQDDSMIEGDTFTVKGYAVGQDGSPVSTIECVLLKQLDPSESSSSLRDRADKQDPSQWTRAQVQSSSEKDDVKLSWAWTLWEAQVAIPKQDQEGDAVKYGLVARATTASGIVQEKESPWNVRGFQTRSWPVIRGLHL